MTLCRHLSEWGKGKVDTLTDANTDMWQIDTGERTYIVSNQILDKIRVQVSDGAST